MRRHILLVIFGVLGFVFVIFTYFKSQSQLSSSHNAAIRLFTSAKQIESSLDRDILKTRDFLLLTYDPLVEHQSALDDLCNRFRNSQLGLYKKMSAGMDGLIDQYCNGIDSLMDSVEVFKSKNAVYRNSMSFLQRKAANLLGHEERTQNLLVRSSLAYALLSTVEAKSSLEKAIAATVAPHHRSNSLRNLAGVVAHSRQVLQTKERLDEITAEILNSSLARILEDIREDYLRSFYASERTASIYRRILLVTSIILLALIGVAIVKLMRMSHALSLANISLESRVVERTKELVQSQETVAKQQQSLFASAKMSALGEMAGGVAHEINNPLATIQMYAEQMKEMVEGGDINNSLLIDATSTIASTTQRIAKIIKGLRSFSRDDKGDPFQPAIVGALIEDTLVFCREQLQNRGIRLDIQVPPEPLTAECRAASISQVILNLIGNACDAIENQSDPWIRVEVFDRSKSVEILVTDSGSGIPKEIRDKIMQPFFTTKEIGKGTGLGLSISRGIIQSHNGEFSYVESSPNTQFRIVIPKTQQNQGAA